MSNKEIKKLVETLEHTLVSLQNQNNQNDFNIKMLRGKVELKDEIILNRNKQVSKLNQQIQILEKQVKRREALINEKNGSIENLEFLLNKKDEEINQRKEMLEDFDNKDGLILNILNNPSLTDMETVTEIRKLF